MANTSSTCAFIGLGNMGYPMAGHLVAAGHDVQVFNRTSAVAERWVDVAAGIKQLPKDSPLVGEEWISGPYPLLGSLQALEATLAAL